jgi:hypothetical protein
MLNVDIFVPIPFFSALIVERVDSATKYYNGRRTAYRNPQKCAVTPRNIALYPMTTGNESDCESDRWNNRFYAWAFDEKVYRDGNDNIWRSFYRDSASGVDGCPAGGPYNIFDIMYHKDFWYGGIRPPEYYEWSLQHISTKERPYGWNAQYTMLRPTLETLGGWDFFRQSELTDVNRINCHKKVNEDFYEADKNNPKGRSMLPVRRNFYNFRRDYELTSLAERNISYQSVNVSKIYSPGNADYWASSDPSDFQTTYMRKSEGMR